MHLLYSLQIDEFFLYFVLDSLYLLFSFPFCCLCRFFLYTFLCFGTTNKTYINLDWTWSHWWCDLHKKSKIEKSLFWNERKKNKSLATVNKRTRIEQENDNKKQSKKQFQLIVLLKMMSKMFAEASERFFFSESLYNVAKT